MNQTQAGRLLTLAWFLRTQVPRKHFNLLCFTTHHDPKDQCRRPSNEELLTDLAEHKCGTTACALGWCPVAFPDSWELVNGYLPQFTKRRLEYEIGECEFFGVTHDESRHLFYAKVNRTPNQEAAAIEKVVESHGYTYAN